MSRGTNWYKVPSVPVGLLQQSKLALSPRGAQEDSRQKNGVLTHPGLFRPKNWVLKGLPAPAEGGKEHTKLWDSTKSQQYAHLEGCGDGYSCRIQRVEKHHRTQNPGSSYVSLTAKTILLISTLNPSRGVTSTGSSFSIT